jgi:hypothetical protein
VIPIHINDDWNIITRTILPLIWQPSLQPAEAVPFGTGPITFSAFLSPKIPPMAGYGRLDGQSRFRRSATKPSVQASGVPAWPRRSSL